MVVMGSSSLIRTEMLSLYNVYINVMSEEGEKERV